MNPISTNPAILIVYFLAIILSIAIHEYAHVLAAYLQGDQTGRLMGRLTLNPIRHLDLFGTIFMLLSLLSGFGIGWGKPAPFNPNALRYRRWGPTLVAVAGPLSNIVLVGIFGYLAFGFSHILPAENMLLQFLLVMASVNAMLAMFNLLPVPPLDGSRVLGAIFGERNPVLVSLERYGFIIIVFLIIVAPAVISWWVLGGANLIFKALGLG